MSKNSNSKQGIHFGSFLYNTMSCTQQGTEHVYMELTGLINIPQVTFKSSLHSQTLSPSQTHKSISGSKKQDSDKAALLIRQAVHWAYDRAWRFFTQAEILVWLITLTLTF